jgi:hypothetical protein
VDIPVFYLLSWNHSLWQPPACVGSGEGSDHIGSYVCSLSLWSQGNSFTAAPGHPFIKRAVHVAPTCVGFKEGFDHFGSYVRNLSLHFCKRLFLGLEPMTGHKATTLPLRQGSPS